MTGFARRGGEIAAFRWNLEIKSVNNKGLEVRLKNPSFLDGFDLELKKRVSAALTRGSVFLNLFVEYQQEDQLFSINEERLSALADVAKRYKGVAGLEPARLDGLFAVRGVIEEASSEPSEDEVTLLKQNLLTELDILLADLVSARRDEGERMKVFLAGQLGEMRTLVKAAKEAAGDRSQAMQNKFMAQLQKLENIAKPVPEDRLAQEIALLVVKADIQEELDRLESHFNEGEKLLELGEPVGRRLDFLCQEFNREANTLCSKANDATLTKIGVDLKVLIDQFREQVQNIE
jgi:uncharacterized protein (TIGR00255 family)